MNLSELKKLAEAATPGPWVNMGDSPYLHFDVSTKSRPWNTGVIGRFDYSLKDMAYVAAANPQTILQMIAVMEQMAEALETCKREMQGDKWDSLYIDGSLAAYKEMMK